MPTIPLHRDHPKLTGEALPRLEPDSRAAVAARDLSRRFGVGDVGVDALRHVSLDVLRGSFTAIMGASGSGKSTLLNLLAGLDQPTSGTVWIDGVDITRLSDRRLTLLRRERIGFVFQAFNLLPMLDVRENVELPMRIAGKRPDPVWEAQLLAEIGLESRVEHLPAELSGGQQQRVAIARALIARPAVVFADEPTGNLDSKTGDETLTLLRRSVDELHQTLVMVTHDARAASHADRIVFLRDGAIVLDRPGLPAPEILDVIKTLEHAG